MKNLMPGTITAFVLLSLGLGLAPQSAFAESVKSIVQKGGANCKMKAVEQFSVPMSDVTVSLAATLSIDDITVKYIKESGLSFNWTVTRDGKKTEGYCDTDIKGNITEFKQ